MTIDELKALLEAGKITKEQFLAMAKAIDPEYKEPEEDPDDNPDDGGGDGKGGDDIEKIVQRAVDRATNRLGNDNKKLKQQLEALKKSKLTAEEAAELERKQREDDLAERERALAEKENRLYAIKAIKKAGLDDGSDSSLALVDFVLAEDEAGIDERVSGLSALITKLVKSEVDKTFKENGRTPGQGKGGSGDKNPWGKETWNITEQMRIELSDPEKAKQLKAAAAAAYAK